MKSACFQRLGAGSGVTESGPGSARGVAVGGEAMVHPSPYLRGHFGHKRFVHTGKAGAGQRRDGEMPGHHRAPAEVVARRDLWVVDRLEKDDVPVIGLVLVIADRVRVGLEYPYVTAGLAPVGPVRPAARLPPRPAVS